MVRQRLTRATFRSSSDVSESREEWLSTPLDTLLSEAAQAHPVPGQRAPRKDARGLATPGSTGAPREDRWRWSRGSLDKSFAQSIVRIRLWLQEPQHV